MTPTSVFNHFEVYGMLKYENIISNCTVHGFFFQNFLIKHIMRDPLENHWTVIVYHSCIATACQTVSLYHINKFHLSLSLGIH